MRIRLARQLALVGGIYACIRGCETLVRVSRGQSLPECARCVERTSWVLQSDGEGRSKGPSNGVVPETALSLPSNLSFEGYAP